MRRSGEGCARRAGAPSRSSIRGRAVTPARGRTPGRNLKGGGALKIAFVVEFLDLTGGHIAVVEIANRLAAKGHDVALVYPRRSALSRRNDVLRLIDRSVPVRLPDRLWRQNIDELGWSPFSGRIIAVQDLDKQPSEHFDVVVATAWRTARAIASWTSRPRTIYFVQHYETWSGRTSQVDATWRLPFELVVSSEWLRTLARERFGRTDVSVVPYGVDLDLFQPGERTPESAPRVGFLYHVEEWKGIADTLEAIRIVRTERELTAVAFGAFDDQGDLPPNTELHVRPLRSALPSIYTSLDAFVCGSWSETGPMTIPEAMACAIPLVSTDVGNVGLWTADGEFARVVPARRPDLLAQALNDVLSDPDASHRRAEAGAKAISAFTWDHTANAFAQVVERP